MIQPIQIRFRPGEGSETIEIASGEFLGHFVGSLSYLSSHNPPRWSVNGQKFYAFDAALHACVAAAYAYVAQQTDEAAAEDHDPADDAD